MIFLIGIFQWVLYNVSKIRVLSMFIESDGSNAATVKIVTMNLMNLIRRVVNRKIIS